MDIKTFIGKYYGLEVIDVEQLVGYDNINHKIVTKNAIYVLKESNSSAYNTARNKAEYRILNILQSLKNFVIPEVIPNKDNKYLTHTEAFSYRLLTYLPGDFLGEVPHTKELLQSFGRGLAEMNKMLLDHEEPAINGELLSWDLQYFKKNEALIPYLQNARDESLVRYFFRQYEAHVEPIAYTLRKNIVHNDANHWNVLTQNGKLSGIIDFGDMCHTWLISELAIALAYVLMEKEDELGAAQIVLKAYHEVLPLQVEEVDVLYYLIAARLCTTICNAAYTKTLKPEDPYISISVKPAWELLRKWITINPISASNKFRQAIGIEQSTYAKEKQLKRRKQHFSKSLSISYKDPIYMNKAAFQYMYDQDGNTYLDAYNNIMLVGHSHPEVVQAAHETMNKLNTNTRYIYNELLDYGEALLAKFPESLSKIFLVNSGSAASDLAQRLATNFTRKKKFMVLEHGYHGNTVADIDISAYKYSKSEHLGRADHILEVALPKVYGSGFSSEVEAGIHYASEVQELIVANPNEIAAFIAEPIVGCGGQVPLPKGYLKEIYPNIRKQGGVCISDEVQVGFGRLGDCFWGYEMYGVVPDIVILGKPMGNGHPIGAVVTTEAIATSFEEGPEFFSSFGGNPVSCAIGLTVLNVLEQEQLQENAKEIGDYLIEGFHQLQLSFPEIGDVRGKGLFLGVEIIDENGKPNTTLAQRLKNNLRENHILIGTDGPNDNVLKIKPPLVFNKENANTLLTKIEGILREMLKS